MWIYAQKFRISERQFIGHMQLKKKEDQRVDALGLLRRGEQNTHRRKYRDKVWSIDWRKGHPESALPGDPSHIQSPNPDTFVDANKCLQTDASYSCFLRGSTSAWQIQRWILAAIYWTEHRAPNEGARESMQGAEGVWSPIGRTTIWTNQVWSFHCILDFLDVLS